MQKLAIIALALMTYSVTMGGISIAQNDSVPCPPCETEAQTPPTEETEPEVVATGQETVPVESTTGEVEQAAPADAIDSLLTTIFTVAIPAVTGLIIAVATLARNRSTNKHVQENATKLIESVKYIDTIAPKIHEQYVASGATKAALNIIIPKLPPEVQEQVHQATNRIPDADAKIRELSAQISDLRSKLGGAVADSDASIPRLAGSKVKTDEDKIVS